MTGQIAKAGYNAEKLLKPEHFQKYFNNTTVKNVYTLNRLKVKTDLVLEFDTRKANVQTKNGNNTRGHAIDRRKLSYFQGSTLHDELNSVCLFGPYERGKTEIVREDVLKYLSAAFHGDDDNYRPEYMVHTMNGSIVEFQEMGEFFEKIKKGLYERPLSKRTCVWLSDALYIQRKGSGKDRRADDLQLKFRYRYL